MANYRNGDIKITKCQLSSLDGKRTLNILPQVSFINIYESIIQPVLVGDIVFTDGIGLRSNFPLLGEELIELEFATPELDKISYTFYLWQYGNVSYSNNMKSLTYSGQMISKQGIINNTKLITRRYQQQISTTISNILTDDLNVTGDIFIEPTVGVDNYLMSNVQPLQMIDSLRHRAVSAKYKSSSFIFYQDRKGYHFNCLEQMIENSSKSVATYNYDQNLVANMTTDQSFFNMLTYSPIQTANIIDKLHHGGSANIIKRFDMITGQTTDVAYSDSNQTFSKTGDQGRDQSSTFTQMFGRSTPNKQLVSFDTGTSPHLTEKVSNLKGFVNRINQNIVNATIYGNSSLLLGNSIDVNTTNGNSLTSKGISQQTDKYIVSKIRHMITVSDKPIYTQSIELLGNGLNG